MLQKTHHQSPQRTKTLEQAQRALNAGNLQEAERLYSQLLLKALDDFDANYGLALIYMAKKDWHSAYQIFDTLTKSPHDKPPVIYAYLSRALEMLGQFEEALTAQKEAVKRQPDNSTMHLMLGHLYAQLRRPEEARKAYQDALDTDPSCEDAYLRLGAELEVSGDLEEMAAIIEQARKQIPNSHVTAYLRARMERRNGNIEKGISILRPFGKSDADNTVDIHFELGQLYDRANDPDNAFRHFQTANRLQSKLVQAQPISRDYYLDLISSITAALTQDRALLSKAKPVPYTGPSPVFLVGFPRSGTTLLNKALAAHPNVFAVEEIPAMGDVVNRLLQSRRPAASIIRDLYEADDAAINELRTLYFSSHGTHNDLPDNRIIIDKLPLNIVYLPFIHRLFPDAKILLSLRHPYDCVLSSFMQKFSINVAMIHFLNLADTANLYAQTMNLYRQCADTLPLNIHQVRYEDIVADFRSEMSKALEFVGAEWDDSVLDYAKPREGEAAIRTPSYAQITEKIYDRAKNRWLRYRDQIQPVTDLLAPFAEYFGYPMTDEKT